MDIEFKRLPEVATSEIIALMNNPLVRRQMPLIPPSFGQTECDRFLASKEQLWFEHGYGPWAFVLEGKFLGWGGLQLENGEADLGLVLHPDYWGMGKRICQLILSRAFGDMGLQTITVLLPPTRTRVKALCRLGFEKDGELLVGEQRFIRYRLNRSAAVKDLESKR